MDINVILKMLDWNNDLSVQQEGCISAKTVRCLKVFMQPMDSQFNKNIWENCAIILSDKEDELLTPYLMELLDWLQDLSWPGSTIILERLQKYRDYENLGRAISNRIVVANALKDEVWLSSLAELLLSNEVKKNLKDDACEIIETYLE